MIYGYIRAGIGRKTAEKQRFEIRKFAKQSGIAIDRWIEAGSVKQARRKDIVIASEISRFGSSLPQVMGILNSLLDAGAKVWTIKDGYRLGDGMSSKALAFAFGLSAEIERKIVSERTKEGMARMRSEGKAIGRPAGRRNAKPKLADWAGTIHRLLSSGHSKAEVARKLHVHRDTLAGFIKGRSTWAL